MAKKLLNNKSLKNGIFYENLILLYRVYFKIPAVNIKISILWLKGKINKNLLEAEGRIFHSIKRAQAKTGGAAKRARVSPNFKINAPSLLTEISVWCC